MEGKPYPEVKVYVVEDGGKLAPIAATIDGAPFPIVEGAFEVAPNGTKHGTRALTATLTLLIGPGSGLVEVASHADAEALIAGLEGAAAED